MKYFYLKIVQSRPAHHPLDGPGEARPAHKSHPGEVHHDDPGVEAHPGRAVVGDSLHRVVNVLSRRHPHHLARAEVVKMSPQTLKQFTIQLFLSLDR